MNPVMRIGSRGADAVLLQKALIAAGVLGAGEADGVFGPKTDKAVRSFQRALGLSVDGVVDAATWGVLTPLLPEDEPPVHAPSQPSESQHALWVWSAKNYEGKAPGLLDGIKGWFTAKERKAKELSVEDLLAAIRRTRPRYVCVKAFDGRAPMNGALLDALEPVLDETGARLVLWAYQYPWNPSSSNKRPTLEQCLAYVEEESRLFAAECRKRGAIAACANLEKEWQSGWRGLSLGLLDVIAGRLLTTLTKNYAGRTAVSSFAEPRAFPGMPWRAFVAYAHEQWPQLYSRGRYASYGQRAKAIIGQFSGLGCKRLQFSGPLYRGEKHMADMFSGVTPYFGTKRPLSVEDVVMWWSADQLTEAREAVMLPPA